MEDQKQPFVVQRLADKLKRTKDCNLTPDEFSKLVAKVALAPVDILPRADTGLT